MSDEILKEIKAIRTDIRSVNAKQDKAQGTLDMLYHTETKEGLVPRLSSDMKDMGVDVKRINGDTAANAHDIILLQARTKRIKDLSWMADVIWRILTKRFF